MKVKNKYSGRTLTLKDDEWEVVKEPEPECVKELSSKITETVLARIEEYLPKSNKGMSFFKYYEMGDESASLNAAISKAIRELREDGTLRAISEKYLGMDITSDN